MADKVQKTIHCRRVSMQGVPAGLTFQQLLTSACTTFATGAGRSMQIDPPHGRTHRLIAQHYSLNPGYVGVLVQYEQGTHAVSLIEDLTKSLVDLEAFAPPPTTQGDARQWVEGLLYFYVRNNTVVFIQSASLRAGQFEEYLSWLLTKNQAGQAGAKAASPVQGHRLHGGAGKAPPL